MNREKNDVAQGQTGDLVLRSGRYSAVGCCRMTKALNQGDLFPACPAHGRCTVWGWASPGDVADLAATGLPASRR
jgi:hypothetical protein